MKDYATVSPESSNILLHNGKAKYALYPVWLLNTTWKGQKYTFAMNGQTGKLVGDLPTDMGKFWAIFAAIAVPVSAIAAAILMLM